MKRMHFIRTLFKDPRDYQITFLSLFLFLGVYFRDFSVKNDVMFAAVASCLLAQFVLDSVVVWRWRKKGEQGPRPKSGIRSALITGLSFCLLLRANTLLAMSVAGLIGIGSKFVLRYKGKHFFNPSNLGVIAAIVLTNDAWVTPGQWGDDLWIVMVVAGAGCMVVRKVGRFDTTGAFFASYAFLEAFRNWSLGWTWDVFFHRMSSGSLLLFSFFMITDPRVIPDHKRARILWAVSVAGLTYVLRNKFFMPTAPFWALLILSPLTPVFDRIWPSSRFEWKPGEAPQEAPTPVAASA